MEYSFKELPFIDILIKNKKKTKKNGQIITPTTDIQQYFHFNSHHPQNCIKSTPYTLAR